MPTSDAMSADLGPRDEHPHRCAAGHRWQHAGPTAAACQIPTYDHVLGGLPVIGAADCPVCCGRTDLLTRELHAHYCNMCDGEWDHAGECLDNLVACCPWCFPKAAAEPSPGARRGAHFHFCPECGQNWRHAIGCGAPLRATLPECTGCQYPPPAHEPEPAVALGAVALGAARAVGDLVRPFALPAGIAAIALLSISIALKGYSARWGSAVDSNHPMVEKRVETSALVPTQPVLPPPEPTRDQDSSPAPQHYPARKEPRHTAPKAPRPRELPVATPTAPPAEPAPVVAQSGIVDSPLRATEAPPAVNEIVSAVTPVRADLQTIPGAPPFSGMSGSSARDTSLEGHPRRVRR